MVKNAVLKGFLSFLFKAFFGDSYAFLKAFLGVLSFFKRPFKGPILFLTGLKKNRTPLRGLKKDRKQVKFKGFFNGFLRVHLRLV